ncbi:hypothetical protein ACWNT8_15095 [Pigmentibacter ruber]|uniref:hypothetical protein n=1 Tax=Pigmentibacter ruber TaxID=2683196 RepID=UPI00131B4936|nr:hypothetical protein [Pigmentibacter ruber]BFD31378.1 hypothetical protein GTC16762_09960 [Pigmentibacter ruber]
MKFMFTLSCIGLLAIPSIAFSSDLSTKWNIKNNAKESISLKCGLANSDVQVSMSTKIIAAGKSEVFDWGDNYYNDGLWLNAGSWKCEAKNKTKLPAEFEAFKTDWGESIALVVNEIDGKLKLEKLEKSDSSIAVKEKVKPK